MSIELFCMAESTCTLLTPPRLVTTMLRVLRACLYVLVHLQGNGKLRILYEGFPMAMIMEHAGGKASTGMFRGAISNILDLCPTGIHDKCPVIIGCVRDVERVLSHYA
jgi:fructose-1,6-bisphosphatase